MKLVYSKGDKFCCATFSAGLPEVALKSGYVEVSDEDYVALCNRTKCWENGILVDYIKTAEDIAREKKRDTQKRIDEYKANLARTDYQAIKYAEGLLTEAEYAPIKEQRQNWRYAINALMQ